MEIALICSVLGLMCSDPCADGAANRIIGYESLGQIHEAVRAWHNDKPSRACLRHIANTAYDTIMGGGSVVVGFRVSNLGCEGYKNPDIRNPQDTVFYALNFFDCPG